MNQLECVDFNRLPASIQSITLTVSGGAMTAGKRLADGNSPLKHALPAITNDD